MKYEHPLYQIDSGNSDATAWAFVTPEKIEKINFNFYPLRPNEIRAKVLYCGLCHSDTFMSRRLWFENVVYPIVAGHEIVAEVEDIGSEVKDFSKGDKVGFGFQRDCCDECDNCFNGKETLCEKVSDKAVFGKYFGGFATKVQQPAKFFFKLPKNLDIKKSPSLFCAGITVFSPIKYYSRPGDRTAVMGIGGLGHMAVQFLSKLGYNVTAFNNVKEYNDLILKLGANEVVDIENEESFSKYDSQFDFIINTLPVGENFENLMRVAKPRCRFIQVGLPAVGDYLKVPAIPLVFKEIQIIGSLVGNRKDMRDMLELCSEKNIYPICEIFKFDEFEEAISKIEKGHPKFRITIDMENN